MQDKAVFIVLLHDADIDGVAGNVTNFEKQLHGRLGPRHDWVFISSERFTRQFVAAVTSVSSSPCYFETVSRERHNISAWIDQRS
ncbi:hypothetical protein GGR56DRAFT_658230 [Xylariaceae sp. FL0804]|nr:hypothetical protein GGR56DRAFT_658230 [Xylariaceae sp. FL0804]